MRILMIILLFPSVVFAGRYWSESEKATLNVVADLGISGTERFVDGVNGLDGTGGHDGTTFGKAWKTLAYATNHYIGRIGPGYILRISSGIYLDDTMDLTGVISGGPARLYIGAYGNGEVVLDYRLTASWVQDSLISQIWYSDLAYNPRAVIQDDAPLYLELSSSALNAGKYAIGTSKVWVWLTDGGNPSNHDVAVIRDYKDDNGVYLNGVSSITIYGLTVKYPAGKGFEVKGAYNHIKKCDVRFSNNTGYSCFNDPAYNYYSSGTVFAQNHLYYGFMDNWPRGRAPSYTHGLWGQGISGQSSYQQTIEGNIVEFTGGEGIGNMESTYLTIKDNIVSNSWSMQIYIDSCKFVNLERNFLYNSITSTGMCYNNEETEAAYVLRSQKRLFGIGINVADEGGTNPTAQSDFSTIRNNIIVNCPTGIGYLGENLTTPVGGRLINCAIQNNTIITMDRYFFNSDALGLESEFHLTNGTNTFTNNVVYASSCSYAVYMTTAAGQEPFYEQTWSNNIFYAPTNTTPFRYNNTSMNYATWTNLDSPAQNSGGSYDNPDLYDINWLNIYSSMTYLTNGSPAINAGADLSAFFTDDFFQATRNTFDIGAHEYDGTQGNAIRNGVFKGLLRGVIR